VDVASPVGRAIIMILRATAYVPLMFSKRRRPEVAYQLFLTGIASLPVLTVVALFTGMIFALQTGMELKRFGQEIQVGSAVTLVMLREMGPFMTGMIITASVGSSIAAQIGTMSVSEEISALELMSIDPVKFLVMPRLVAFGLMLPLLTFYTDILAIIGGGLIGYTQLGIEWRAYFENATVFATNKDLFTGLFKAFCFGVIICMVACHQGFETRGGAVGVGRATRNTVVISFLVILVTGFILTKLFYA